MDRLEQIKNEVARENEYSDWNSASRHLEDNMPYRSCLETEGLVNEVARRYATEMIRHDRERVAKQAAIEVESRLSGKTIHGSINSEYPQWVARVNRESITSLDIELI